MFGACACSRIVVVNYRRPCHSPLEWGHTRVRSSRSIHLSCCPSRWKRCGHST